MLSSSPHHIDPTIDNLKALFHALSLAHHLMADDDADFSEALAAEDEALELKQVIHSVFGVDNDLETMRATFDQQIEGVEALADREDLPLQVVQVQNLYKKGTALDALTLAVHRVAVVLDRNGGDLLPQDRALVDMTKDLAPDVEERLQDPDVVRAVAQRFPALAPRHSTRRTGSELPHGARSLRRRNRRSSPMSQHL